MPPDDPFAYYLWEVLSVETTAVRREMAIAALKRIPALTPESIARAAPARIERAVALAGPKRDDRLRAIRTGVEFFRQHPSIAARLRGPLPDAAEAAAGMPRITEASADRVLLLAGSHPVFPSEPGIDRVIRRLESLDPASSDTPADFVVRQLGQDLDALRVALVYLAHHALATCTAQNPHCRICPLMECPERIRRNGAIS